MQIEGEILREIIREELASVNEHLETLRQEVATLRRVISQSHEPLIKPSEACQILGVGRDRLNNMCSGDRPQLEEGIHWRWKNPDVQLDKRRRVFYRDLVVDYAVRGESDPVAHEKYCFGFHSKKAA